MGANSVWASATVSRVTNNFVHIGEHARAAGKKAEGSVTVRAGMLVDIVVPPLDDKVTTLQIVAVGIIYAASCKYRAVVCRRRTDPKKKYGPLETLNMASFPTRACCNVSDPPTTQTTTPMHTLKAPPSHTRDTVQRR